MLFKKFLFYAPCCFFFLLLVFSITIYCLRFEHTNGTTPLAVDTLTNFGQALNKHPIVDLKIKSKYKGDKKNDGLNTCEDIGEGADKGQYTEVTFGEFNKIDAGCVCRKTNSDGNSVLTYHDEDYCEDNLTNC